VLELSICVRIIDFASFHDFSIGFWNCSDSMVIIFHFIIYENETFFPMKNPIRNSWASIW